MDKRVIFAVAGSGKTQYIIDKLTIESRALIVTYTVKNTENLKKRVLNKFGFIPEGVRIYTYFSFLLKFCIRPIVGDKLKVKSICFENQPRRFAKKKTDEYYLTNNGYFYSNRMAKYLIDFELTDQVLQRIEKYFDLFCIDEVQDFAASDFNLLCELPKANIEILCVGDFFQHTFKTSFDGTTRKNLHDEYEKYYQELQKAGYTIDRDTLSHSYRCSPTVCQFISDKIGIEIMSHRTDEINIELIENSEQIKMLMENDSIIKLFYQNSYTYHGRTDNWGNTKGLDDFNDVCVVLNKTTYKAYVEEDLSNLKPLTKCKLYVACTRAKGNIYFISETELVNYKKI